MIPSGLNCHWIQSFPLCLNMWEGKAKYREPNILHRTYFEGFMQSHEIGFIEKKIIWETELFQWKISICTKIIYYLILNLNIEASFEIFPHWHSLQSSSCPHHRSRPPGGQRGIPAPGLILTVGIVSGHSQALRPWSVSRILTRNSRMTRNWPRGPLDIPDLSEQRVLSLCSICNCQDTPGAKTDPWVHKTDHPG